MEICPWDFSLCFLPCTLFRKPLHEKWPKYRVGNGLNLTRFLTFHSWNLIHESRPEAKGFREFWRQLVEKPTNIIIIPNSVPTFPSSPGEMVVSNFWWWQNLWVQHHPAISSRVVCSSPICLESKTLDTLDFFTANTLKYKRICIFKHVYIYIDRLYIIR